MIKYYVHPTYITRILYIKNGETHNFNSELYSDQLTYVRDLIPFSLHRFLFSTEYITKGADIRFFSNNLSEFAAQHLRQALMQEIEQ